MNDKDKEEFDKWFLETYRYDYKELVIPESVKPQKEAWQAACEYKQKEIDELKDRLHHEVEMIDGAAKDHIEKLQAENAKLIETLKLAVESASFFSKFADCTKDYWSCRCEFCRRNKIISRG